MLVPQQVKLSEFHAPGAIRSKLEMKTEGFDGFHQTPFNSNFSHLTVDSTPDSAVRQAKKRWKVQENQALSAKAD